MQRALFYNAYHEIEAADSGYLYQVTCTRFEEHLALAGKIRDGKVGSRKEPAFNFDDGHISNYENGFRLLQKHGAKGIFFVTAGWTSSRPGFMTKAHLREISDAGHEVQGHGLTHLLLTHATDAQLEEELARSKQLLEDATGRAVDALSMPGGRWDARVLRACAQAGYKRVFTSEAWSETYEAEGVQVLGRMMMRRTTTAEELLRMMNLSPLELAVRRGRYAAKEAVKKVVGDRIYQAVWRKLAKHEVEEADAMAR
jgi:peptidoglycan/xylan/chitin deacetylase (PgdA/CDA1 family)